MLAFLRALEERGLLMVRRRRDAATTLEAPRPYTLVAELTYRCPLSCAYCSNPLELDRHAAELDTADWARVFAEAAALGVLQVNLTGGEPLVRDDLEELVAAARASELYVNLITSGIPADAARLARLAAAGLDSLQLSVQDSDPQARPGSPGATASRPS